jgi:hypothetical protein
MRVIDLSVEGARFLPTPESDAEGVLAAMLTVLGLARSTRQSVAGACGSAGLGGNRKVEFVLTDGANAGPRNVYGTPLAERPQDLDLRAGADRACI